jgi:alanine racemase
MSVYSYRPTWAEVDLSALDYNFRQIKKMVGKNTRVMAVVKCNAYGHGILPMAKRLTKLGVDYLGVVSVEEGIFLREHRIAIPILILGNIIDREVKGVVDYNLSQTVSDYHLAAALNKKAKGMAKKVCVHIKVDTGMGRLGILYRDAKKIIEQIIHLRNLRVDGLFTHFPSADSDHEFTNYQIDIFNQLIRDLKGKGIHFPLLHAANSMGIIGYPESHFNLVRPGLMLYGIYPKAGLAIKLKPVLSLRSRITYLKRLPPGQGISYGRSYITKKETNVAVLPIGYGDGYPRNLSNRADVLIKGKRFRISGAVCMDQIIVDLGDCKIRLGDEVVLIGRQGSAGISVEELAKLSGTIPYEIVCGIDSRVTRLYIN